jgi:hypothetical protein
MTMSPNLSPEPLANFAEKPTTPKEELFVGLVASHLNTVFYT